MSEQPELTDKMKIIGDVGNKLLGVGIEEGVPIIAVANVVEGGGRGGNMVMCNLNLPDTKSGEAELFKAILVLTQHQEIVPVINAITGSTEVFEAVLESINTQKH